jgi:hypothetical protein
MAYKDQETARKAWRKYEATNRDKEKQREYNKKYQQENKERILEQKREYNKRNKEKKRQYDKEYREKHKEKLNKQASEYSKRTLNDPNKKRNRKKTSWKRQGFKGDLDDVYDDYISTKNCPLCKVELKDGTGANCRCADHNHTTGYYRETICQKCNFKRQYIEREQQAMIFELKNIQNPKPVLLKFFGHI